MDIVAITHKEENDDIFNLLKSQITDTAAHRDKISKVGCMGDHKGITWGVMRDGKLVLTDTSLMTQRVIGYVYNLQLARSQ